MLTMLLAAIAAAVDPAAAQAVAACRAATAAGAQACDVDFRGARLRLDARLHGIVRAGGGMGWSADCPYDVVHHSGGCVLAAHGVMVLLPYGRPTPGFEWGDRNADNRERQISFDGGRTANWTNAMGQDDAREVLALLRQTRRATFRWRAARAKVLSATTLDMAGFDDVATLLPALTQAAADLHAGG